jgi:hypothetical protein
MLTPDQAILLIQLKNVFSRMEELFTPQQLDQFQQSWFTLNPRRDIFQHEQQQLSLDRQKNFQSARQHQGI